MRTVVAQGHVDLTMISPIGLPIWPLSLKEPYASLRQIPFESEASGLKVLYPRFTLIPKWGGDSNPKRIAKAVLPLARSLHAQNRFDLVDAQFFFPDGPAAAIIARELGLPLTIKSRGADIHYWGARPKARKQMLAAAQAATGMQAVSKALREDMIALGMPANRISVHYTGLDRARFHPIDRATARQVIANQPNMGIGLQGRLLVTPGALIPRKGQRLVIEALATLPNTQLALAGTGEDLASLHAYANTLGLTDRVHFLGQIGHDILPTLMCAADVVVLPSASEGLANVWIEALACGTPIVVPDIGGAAEVLHHHNGRQIGGRMAARDPKAIASAVIDILSDQPSQQEVADTVTQFSWDTNAQNLVRLWQGVLDKGPAKST